MIIVISGSVGCGKTTLTDELAKKLDFDVVHLNEFAEEFKLEEHPTLQTFDFDIDALLDKIEDEIKIWKKEDKNVIIESHFAHFISHKLVDRAFIINRNLKELKEEYEKRNYNENKIKDNLEVETLNLCFYEAIENGYEEGQVFSVENNSTMEHLIEKISIKLKK